jgi:hypothetical protein
LRCTRGRTEAVRDPDGLDVGGKVMQEVINALKTKGLVSGPQKSLLDSMPKVRDAAMHTLSGKRLPLRT